jgi:hypothetical protein
MHQLTTFAVFLVCVYIFELLHLSAFNRFIWDWLGSAETFGFDLFYEGCWQCLAKPSSESSKRIGMSTMGGEFFVKKHEDTKERLYERTTTRLHERTMAQAEVHPYNKKQA